MSDRINGIFVVFEDNIRDDDAEATLNAIRQIKGVLSVKANVSDHTEYIAQSRIRSASKKYKL